MKLTFFQYLKINHFKKGIDMAPKFERRILFHMDGLLKSTTSI